MNKYSIIITQLQKHSILSARELANIIHCSDRSIRNYIQEINAYKLIIRATPKGYQLCEKDVEDSLLNFSNVEVKDKERYIVNTLLLANNGVAKYTFQEKLFVSDQTIDTYIKSINKQIKTKHLRICKRRGFLYLDGEEENKRKLLKENLRINNYDMIEKELTLLCNEKNIPYETIRKILTDALHHYQIHVNDYSLLNILTHLSVKIIRINVNKFIPPKKISFDKEKYSKQLHCSEEICRNLNKILQIQFSIDEKDTLALLLISKSDTSFLNEFDQVDIRDFVKSTLVRINEHYGIDLYDTEFINFFTLHLKNLLKRVELDKYNANPLFEQVLNFNSLVYDIAVFVASRFTMKYHLKLPKEEIAFLAFHIGSIVVKKNLLDEDIYIAIETYDFYRYADILKIKLIECLPNYVHVDFIDQHTVLPDSFSYDLIVSTNAKHLTTIPTKRTLNISLLLNDVDMDKIKDEIHHIKKIKKQFRIQSYFEQFFNFNFFEKNVYFSNPQDYISYMSEKLLMHQFVPESFQQSVLDREDITPTSFDNGVALPHALQCSSIRNCAYVIINDTSIPWGSYDVNIIILIGINEKDQHDFKFLYDNLLHKLNETQFLKKAILCKEYRDFLAFISEI